MVRQMARLATAVTLALMAPVALSAQATDRIGIPVGSFPPAVQIEDLDGEPVDLSAYVGQQPVLLEFWATWCEVCEELAPRMEAAHRRYGSQVEFLAVSVAVNQTKRSIHRHLARHPMSYRVLWDTNGRATRAFEAPTTSYVVVLDKAGRVAYTGVGADQDIEGALKRVIEPEA